jgi:hypothetical protein
METVWLSLSGSNVPSPVPRNSEYPRPKTKGSTLALPSCMKDCRRCLSEETKPRYLSVEPDRKLDHKTQDAEQGTKFKHFQQTYLG